MNKWLAVLLLFLFLFLAIGSILLGNKVRKVDVTLFNPSPTKTASSQQSSPTQTDSAVVSVVAQNLEVPWGLTFLPDKSILFTERPGRVRLIAADGSLRQESILTISDVKQQGEGGLLGITIDPKFADNKFVYLYYSYGTPLKNKLVRYTFLGSSLQDEKVLLEGVSGNSNHDGGRIKFGPDGYLYITTGDSENPSLAQDKTSPAGKILRVTDEGKPAPGNPFGTVVYSYGHRNPQGLAWDGQGRLFATEHGRSAPTGYDELNLIEAGKNYGWPTIQGDEKKEGMVTPLINSGATTTWAPSGAAYYNGSVFFGGLRGEALYEAVINGTSVTLKKHLEGQFGRLRDVVLGPDNMLYITTSNRDGRGGPKENDDKILRVNPAKL